MTRQEASEQRREKILTSALEAFTTKGIFETTMADIRRLSGASTGSVYHHFDGKQHIAFELYLEGIRQLYALALDKVTENPSAEEGIKLLVRGALDWHNDNRTYGTYLFRAADTGFIDEHYETLRAQQITFLKTISTWFVPKVKAGKIRDIPPHLQLPMALGPTREFLRMWLPECPEQKFLDAMEVLPEAAWQSMRGPNT